MTTVRRETIEGPYTKAERDALVGMLPGMLIFNSTAQRIERYSGAAWVAVPIVASLGAYDPGTITVATEQYLLQLDHLKLAGSERLTIEGTGRVIISDFDNYETPNVNYVGHPRDIQLDVMLRDGYVWDVRDRLILLSTARAYLIGTSRVNISDDFTSRSRIVLRGQG